MNIFFTWLGGFCIGLGFGGILGMIVGSIIKNNQASRKHKYVTKYESVPGEKKNSFL